MNKFIYTLSCEEFGTTLAQVEFDVPVSKGDTMYCGGIKARVGEVFHSPRGTYLCLIPYAQLPKGLSNETVGRYYNKVHLLIERYKIAQELKDEKCQ